MTQERLVDRLRAKGRELSESLFPPFCVYCRKTFTKRAAVRDLCPSCMARLPWRTRGEAVLPVLANRMERSYSPDKWRSISAMKVIAPLHYRDEVPYLLRNLKFHNRLDVAEALADLMEMAVRLHPLEPFDAIVAVPLHPKRMHERGYNQADELCKHLAKKLSIAHLSMAIERRVHTKRQSELDYALRVQNLDGAFVADSGILARRHVLLVDDILTSGTTMWSAMQAVEAAGVKSVTGLVVASGRKREVSLATET